MTKKILSSLLFFLILVGVGLLGYYIYGHQSDFAASVTVKPDTFPSGGLILKVQTASFAPVAVIDQNAYKKALQEGWYEVRSKLGVEASMGKGKEHLLQIKYPNSSTNQFETRTVDVRKAVIVTLVDDKKGYGPIEAIRVNISVDDDELTITAYQNPSHIDTSLTDVLTIAFDILANNGEVNHTTTPIVTAFKKNIWDAKIQAFKKQ